LEIDRREEQRILMRLTALWGLNETALGGVLHLFRSPFTGIFVGGLAIILISLIAYFSSNPMKSILKALVVVLIIKFTLSPHSPITAYVAVTFQALVGGLLFQWLPFRLAAVLFALVAMLESVFQKLVVFTLLFGKPFWKSLDIFMEQLLSKLGFVDSMGKGSLIIIGSYAALYAVSGLFIARYIIGLPPKLNVVLSEFKDQNFDFTVKVGGRGEKKRKIWLKWMPLVIILALIMTFLPGASLKNNAVFIFLRATSVLLLWFLIVSPILRYFLKRFIEQKRTTYESEVGSALELLPVFKQLLSLAWEDVSELKGIKKIDQWVLRSLGYCLSYNSDKNVEE